MSNCNVRGCGRGHNYLLHDVLQNEEVMMVRALPGRTSEPESSLRCRQMVAAENEGQCFRLNVLYDWGATVSMISEEAVEVMGLAVTKQAKSLLTLERSILKVLYSWYSPALSANTRLGWKGFPGANALAYYEHMYNTLHTYFGQSATIKLTQIFFMIAG